MGPQKLTKEGLLAMSAFGGIVVQNSKTRLRRWFSLRVTLGGFASLFLTRRLHRASSYCRRGSAEEFGKTAQVLRGCGQQHFVLCIARLNSNADEGRRGFGYLTTRRFTVRRAAWAPSRTRIS